MRRQNIILFSSGVSERNGMRYQTQEQVRPEGGFDKTEIDVALKNNFKTVTLGKNILRVETAAIVAASILTSIYNV